jgi:hypothetical protein
LDFALDDLALFFFDASFFFELGHGRWRWWRFSRSFWASAGARIAFVRSRLDFDAVAAAIVGVSFAFSAGAFAVVIAAVARVFSATVVGWVCCWWTASWWWWAEARVAFADIVVGRASPFVDGSVAVTSRSGWDAGCGFSFAEGERSRHQASWAHLFLG